MVTAQYAFVLTCLFLILTTRVIVRRRGKQVAFGMGNDRLLERRIRIHGNFAEYVPLCLLLMALAELQSAPVWSLHVGGAMLVFGRIVHALSVGREPEFGAGRVVGMTGTLAALLFCALIAAFPAFVRGFGV